MTQESTQGKLLWVTAKVKGHIASFDQKAKWYQRLYFGTSITVLVISALITLISGLQPALPAAIRADLTMILSTTSMIITGWGLFYSPKNSWLLFASSVNQLRALRAKLEFAQAGATAPDEDERLAVDIQAEMQGIIDALNKAWLELRSASGASVSSPHDRSSRP